MPVVDPLLESESRAPAREPARGAREAPNAESNGEFPDITSTQTTKAQKSVEVADRGVWNHPFSRIQRQSIAPATGPENACAQDAPKTATYLISVATMKHHVFFGLDIFYMTDTHCRAEINGPITKYCRHIGRLACTCSTICRSCEGG